jgi:hypothetical protein
MRRVIRGYAKDKYGNLALIGTVPVPISKDKCSPAARREKRCLVRQGATIFKKETIRWSLRPSDKASRTMAIKFTTIADRAGYR